MPSDELPPVVGVALLGVAMRTVRGSTSLVGPLRHTTATALAMRVGTVSVQYIDSAAEFMSAMYHSHTQRLL